MSQDLTRSPDTLEDLKSVLSVISNIKCMSLEVEIRYRDIKERYRTLNMYKIPVAEEEITMVENIDKRWEELFLQARSVDRSLIKVKKKFTLVKKMFYLLR